MSQNIVDVWDGVQNTNSWVHDGDVERSAVDIVELASSVAGYSAGAQAAAAAASGYADTASGAVASIGTAATDAVQAVQNEGTAQISALVDAGGVQTGLIGSAGAAQLADIVTSGGIQISSVGSAGAAQIDAITSAGGAQVALVSAAGTSATGDLAGVTAAQSAALVSAGGYQSGLIVTAGSAQIAAVQAEGGTQIAAVQLAASAQVSSATVAAMSAGAAASTAQGAASAASGYALTASSYMTSAGGYASAASDSATAAQASAESIEASAEQIQTNERNISNIQALLNGTLYREEVDSTAAYSKAVPTGAMPYASINEIGSRTVVWNQLVNQWATSTVRNGITWTLNDDGSYTAQGTATADSYIDASSEMTGHEGGHKMLIMGCPKGGSATTYMIYDAHRVYTVSADYGDGRIYETSATQTTVACRMYVWNGATVDITFKPRFIDLTLMFGAGNEPSTVAEFEAMFPSIDPAYNAGELKSAGVTQVESEGRNILDVPNGAYTDSNGCYMGATGGLVKVAGASSATVNSDAVYITSWVRFANYGTAGVISESNSILLYPGTYTFSIKNVTGTFGSASLTIWGIVGDIGDTRTSGAYRFSKDLSNTNLTDTFTITKSQRLTIIIQKETPTAQTNVTFNLQLERGSTATAYTPYRAPISLPIPSAIQALPGYGWSAGTAFNYVDYARKVYVQNVGAKDLGSMTWNYNSSLQIFYSNTWGGATPVMMETNLLCPNYKTMPGTNLQTGFYVTDKAICTAYIYAAGSVNIRDSSYTDAASFKAAMQGVMLYYELATPIETDISSLLTDNTIEVEPGGSLTFKNQHGDDWRVPVPNEETFLVQVTPELPSADGTYTLQCTVTDGTPSVTWVTA